jgi:hypothetical protein
MSTHVQPGGFIALVLFVGMQAAEAKQCKTEMPPNPQRHWSYRLIEGRKCWYEGENNMPKSLLQWPGQSSALSAFGKARPSPKEESLPSAAQPVSPDAARDNQSDPESFEARWRALNLR